MSRLNFHRWTVLCLLGLALFHVSELWLKRASDNRFFRKGPINSELSQLFVQKLLPAHTGEEWDAILQRFYALTEPAIQMELKRKRPDLFAIEQISAGLPPFKHFCRKFFELF